MSTTNNNDEESDNDKDAGDTKNKKVVVEHDYCLLHQKSR
jgi:hypothetical protein